MVGPLSRPEANVGLFSQRSGFTFNDGLHNMFRPFFMVQYVHCHPESIAKGLFLDFLD